MVLVDMDNVIADFDQRFREVWETRHPGSSLRDERRHHRIADDLPCDQRAEAIAILAEPGFTAGMAPVDGAREALVEIADHGFAFHICSSPLSARSPNAAEKLDWIEDHLGPEWCGVDLQRPHLGPGPREHAAEGERRQLLPMARR